MRSRNHLRRDDEGVALVMALVFLFVVSVFITVALEKSQSTSMSGATLRERGDLQYALDGGVERAMQLLQEDMADTVDPDLCPSPSPTAQDLTAVKDGTGLTLNGQTVTFTCQGLAGVAAKDSASDYTNYALVITSASTDALTTQSGVAHDLVVGGSVYLAGDVSNSGLGKPVSVEDGDVVQHIGTCDQDDLDAVTNLVVEADQYKTCSPQTVQQAQPAVTLPSNTTGSEDRQGTYVDYPLPVGKGKGRPLAAECRVFFPGRYAGPPDLLAGNGTVNWFLGGLYYFEFPTGDSRWEISNQEAVVVGTPRSGIDEGVAVPSSCPSVSDINDDIAGLPTPLPVTSVVDEALAAKGGTFVLGGPSHIVVRGSLSMASPDPWTTGQPAINLMAVRAVDTGYTTWSGGSTSLIQNDTATSSMVFNAKLFAPDSDARIFASLPNVATIRGGAVLRRLHLGASAAAQDLAIQASGTTPGVPDPYRTVRIVARDSAGTTGTQTAVVNISNVSPYAVTPISWRSE